MPLLALLLACPPAKEPVWYFTCGDPACSSYAGPFDGVPLCTDELSGDPCVDEGAECDPVDDCNALLVCATEDPQDQTGGCPISRAKFKRDIRYLSPEESAAAARTAAGMRLATWNYRWEAPGTPPHLGFVIDDAPSSVAVTADGDHVDLYGYTSLTLAAVQEQERRLTAQQSLIDAQARELAALRTDLDALRAAGDNSRR